MTRNKKLPDRIRSFRQFKAIVSITLEKDNEDAAGLFESAIDTMHYIESVHKLAGRSTYILFIAVKDQLVFDQLINTFNKLSGVTKINSLVTQRPACFKTFAAYDGSSLKPMVHFKTN